jgi:hypothetical protein
MAIAIPRVLLNAIIRPVINILECVPAVILDLPWILEIMYVSTVHLFLIAKLATVIIIAKLASPIIF